MLDLQQWVLAKGRSLLLGGLEAEGPTLPQGDRGSRQGKAGLPSLRPEGSMCWCSQPCLPTGSTQLASAPAHVLPWHWGKQCCQALGLKKATGATSKRHITKKKKVF